MKGETVYLSKKTILLEEATEHMIAFIFLLWYNIIKNLNIIIIVHLFKD